VRLAQEIRVSAGELDDPERSADRSRKSDQNDG
jgi:hypothetical protein